MLCALQEQRSARLSQPAAIGTTAMCRSLIITFVLKTALLNAAVFALLTLLGADRDWQTLALKANTYHIWWPDQPGVIEVEFDHSFAAGYQPKRYTLTNRRVTIGAWQGRTPCATYGSHYVFRKVEGGMDLFAE